jgi:UDP-glucose:tetrahydrobiopterin glucosyltransferase
MRVLVVSTAVGALGSGRGGGVEVTAAALVAGLLGRDHALTVLAGEGSRLPAGCEGATLWCEGGGDQPSWQHRPRGAPVELPADSLLARLWRRALSEQAHFDVIVNLGYDWLPLWLTPHTGTPVAHLVSMGSVATAIDRVITELGRSHPRHLAFHTAAQAADFHLTVPPTLVGNGFDLRRYRFQEQPDPLLGWAGRIAPEKGLEDAAAVAAGLGLPLAVWGLEEDAAYARRVEASVPPGTLQWRGFLPTERLQAELGRCSVLLNTPKWNEAFGNVVVEALACGVPVAAYARGGPAELVQEGSTGALAAPDDLDSLTAAVHRARLIPRRQCRNWVEQHCSQQAFAGRIEAWLMAVIETWTQGR